MVTRAYVLKRLEAEVKRLRYGCGSHGCVVAPPGDVGRTGAFSVRANTADHIPRKETP